MFTIIISKNYILNKVVKESLYNNCLKCKFLIKIYSYCERNHILYIYNCLGKDYVIEALQFNLIKSDGSLSYITAGLNLGLKIKYMIPL